MEALMGQVYAEWHLQPAAVCYYGLADTMSSMSAEVPLSP